jgi:hypothetical protein
MEWIDWRTIWFVIYGLLAALAIIGIVGLTLRKKRPPF